MTERRHGVQGPVPVLAALLLAALEICSVRGTSPRAMASGIAAYRESIATACASGTVPTFPGLESLRRGIDLSGIQLRRIKMWCVLGLGVDPHDDDCRHQQRATATYTATPTPRHMDRRRYIISPTPSHLHPLTHTITSILAHLHRRTCTVTSRL